MHARVRKKLLRRYALIVGQVAVVVGAVWWVWRMEGEPFVRQAFVEDVTIVDDGTMSIVSRADAQTVSDVLRVSGVVVSENDRVFPAVDTPVFSLDVITIDRMHTMTVAVDKERRTVRTFRDRVDEALARGGVHVDPDDLVEPVGAHIVVSDVDVVVTRVTIVEEVVTKKIPFDTKETEDDTVSFLKKIIAQKGMSGTKTITYRVAYHDGAEVKRQVIGEEVTKEPVIEEVVQGTKVTVSKTHKGACSWYSHTGTMAAANPWMPIGSYARVTNMDNGKSVIVRINDRGPFVPGRIIDLDKVAFEKIASLGAGVIAVKMEEIH